MKWGWRVTALIPQPCRVFRRWSVLACDLNLQGGASSLLPRGSVLPRRAGLLTLWPPVTRGWFHQGPTTPKSLSTQNRCRIKCPAIPQGRQMEKLARAAEIQPFPLDGVLAGYLGSLTAPQTPPPLRIKTSTDGHWHFAERPVGSKSNSCPGAFLRIDILRAFNPKNVLLFRRLLAV